MNLVSLIIDLLIIDQMFYHNHKYAHTPSSIINIRGTERVNLILKLKSQPENE